RQKYGRGGKVLRRFCSVAKFSIQQFYAGILWLDEPSIAKMNKSCDRRWVTPNDSRKLLKVANAGNRLMGRHCKIII
ncbi:hypothetical protein N9045_02580, partial [bacterium]|nr:hypothetical protein [bacterium]